MGTKVLGLDLGTSSVGGCYLDGDEIVAAFVRIFPEGMDRTRGEKSLNQDRREARSLRRQGYRRVRRKTKLLNILKRSGLLPCDTGQLQQLYASTNPYELRCKGLTQKLERYDLGRAIYHLGQRRGYLSNRKTGKEKEGAVAAGINNLIDQLGEKHATLGSLFYANYQQGKKIRGCYTARSMYQQEFESICKEQSKYHPKILPPSFIQQLEQAIFFQRPLRIQKHLVGNCEFETGRKRAPVASLAAQEFRLWQSINNLKVLYTDGTESALNETQRHQLYDMLKMCKSMSWNKLLKLFNLYTSDRFNLERVRKSGMLGNQTAALVSSAITKSVWKKLPERKREALINDLLLINTDEALKRRLFDYWQFEQTVVDKLITKSTELPRGYLHISQKAARNITKHMRYGSNGDEPGLTYDKACKLAGYDSSKQKQQTNLPDLPFAGTVTRIEHKSDRHKPGRHSQYTLANNTPVGELRNPLVERALYQLRKVVNAALRKHGKPDIIRMEMARDLKNSAKRRQELEQQNRKFEKLNQQARKFLQEHGTSNPTRTDILKWRLWEECGHQCPFSGKPINVHDLFGGSAVFQIEHIIPYSRSMDNSYLNKTLCHVDWNQRKGNQMPWEAFHGEAGVYEEILQRARKLPYKKFRRFGKDWNMDDRDFVSQQLNETRYIAVKAKQYLEQLGCRVEAVKGGTTGILRRSWQLNGILGDSEQHKQRLDHRHHALDALVIALTNRSAVQQINRASSIRFDGSLRVPQIDPPIKDLRSKAEQVINNIIVSHKPQRKVKGPLHEDTFYSLTNEIDKKGNRLVAIRKPLSRLKPKQLKDIRDRRLQELVIKHLDKHEGDIKKAFGQVPTTFVLPNKSGPRVPVYKVRLLRPENTRSIGQGSRIRNILTGSNHHIELIEVKGKRGEPKWIGRMVSTLDTKLRLAKGETLIDRSVVEGQRFIMALHGNDMVELDHGGERLICYLQKMTRNAQGTMQIIFRPHYDATEKANTTFWVSKSPETLRKSNPRLIEIDPIGDFVYMT